MKILLAGEEVMQVFFIFPHISRTLLSILHVKFLHLFSSLNICVRLRQITDGDN